MFSENLFSIKHEDNLERFQNAWRMGSKKLGEKYDDSTAVVMGECGYGVGDNFPEVRGLMHIKNEIEQKVFKDANANILVVLWSTQCKELNEFLEFVDNLAHQKIVKQAFAINVDRIFLYNEDIQKILIDKLKIQFLRDTTFSNLNNLFSTRFVRNRHNMDSNTPFVIATDANGKIVFSQPVDTKKLDKLTKVFNNIKEGKPAIIENHPLVPSSEEAFEVHFNKVVKELGELASHNPESLDLLKDFGWKGVIAIMITRLEVDFNKSPTF